MNGLLSSRSDRKYFIAAERVGQVAESLGRDLLAQDYGTGVFEFVNAGFYYDTPEFQSYADALQRRPTRWKLRTRAYALPGRNRSSGCFLEAKVHIGETLYKERVRAHSLLVRHPAALLDRAAESHRSDGDDAVLQFLPGILRSHPVEPIVFISYVRRSFEGRGPLGRWRVTLDSDLRYLPVHHADRPGREGPLGLREASVPLAPHLAVVERKAEADDAADLDARLVGEHGCAPCSISKYFCAMTHRVLGQALSREELLGDPSTLRRLVSGQDLPDPALRACIVRTLTEDMARCLRAAGGYLAGDEAPSDLDFLARALGPDAAGDLRRVAEGYTSECLGAHGAFVRRHHGRTPAGD